MSRHQLIRDRIKRTAAAIGIVAAGALSLTGSPSRAAEILLQQNFDADTVGALPAGWGYFPGLGPTPTPVDNMVVTGTTSSPAGSGNVLEIEQQGQNYWTQVTFPGQDLTDTSRTLSWEADINVASLVNNFSAGFQFKLWSGSSQIDAGFYRVLSNSGPTTWNLYAGSFVSAPLNRNQWYHIRVELDGATAAGTPVVGGSGEARLYLVNGGIDTLLDTQAYSGKAGSQVNNISMFTITSQPNGTSPDNIMYLDNLVIAVPEPASVSLLALGAAALSVRRRRVR